MTTYTVRQLGPYAFTLIDTNTGGSTCHLFVGDAARAKAEAARDEANDAGHIHDRTEGGMSDCEFGCKIYRCHCGDERVVHLATYGCKRSTP